jgi:hypothetical protein
VNADSVVEQRPVRPEDDSAPGVWTSRSAILTPGDQFTYKLKVEKGDTLFAAATSDAFDPALAVEDAHKKVLFKNDDRSEGDQSPFVVYRFDTAGDYNLKVLSYRSVSGGKFSLRLRTFSSVDLAPGTIEHKDAHPKSGRVMFRIQAVKGKVYDLRSLTEWRPRSTGSPEYFGTNFVNLWGPTGVEDADLKRIKVADGAPVFEAQQTGDYYADYSCTDVDDPKSNLVFRTDMHEVEKVSVSTTDNRQIDFASRELKLIELPVKANQIVRTALGGLPYSLTMSLVDSTANATGPGTPQEGNGQPYGASEAWSWYRTSIDSNSDIVRVFQKSGTVRFALRSDFYQARKLTLKNSDSLPEWSNDVPLKNSLDIGESQLFLIKSTKSELMRVKAQASHFLPRLDIFRLNGALANSLCDRRTHIATDDLYFPDEGTFVIRLSCEGNGGSGDFGLDRKSATPIAYSLGSDQAMELNGQNFGLYSADLQAGKRYELVLDHPDWPLEVDLLDEDGQFLTSQFINFDNVQVHYFVPTKSGKHRLWLRGGSGKWHFRLALHSPPSIGG